MPPQMPILSSSDNKQEFGVHGRPEKRQGTMWDSSCIINMNGSHLHTGVTGKSKEAVELDKKEGGSLPRHSSLSKILPELLLHFCTLTALPLHHLPKPSLNSSLQKNATTQKPKKGIFRGLTHNMKNLK